MATLDSITALFVGRVVASVDLSFNSETQATQIRSLTFEDGTKITFSGEHDVAYLDGYFVNGEYKGLEPVLLQEEYDEDEPEPVEVVASVRRTLAECMPEWALKKVLASKKYCRLLDLGVTETPTSWPIQRTEAKYVTFAWVVEHSEPGRKTVIGLCNAPWSGTPTILFGNRNANLTFWVPDFAEEL